MRSTFWLFIYFFFSSIARSRSFDNNEKIARRSSFWNILWYAGYRSESRNPLRKWERKTFIFLYPSGFALLVLLPRESLRSYGARCSRSPLKLAACSISCNYFSSCISRSLSTRLAFSYFDNFIPRSGAQDYSRMENDEAVCSGMANAQGKEVKYPRASRPFGCSNVLERKMTIL